MRNKTLLESPQLPTEAVTGGDKPSPYNQEVAAIILAAGRSERMGAFKPLLPFGPKSVIETCIENIRGGGVKTIVVVLGLGLQAERLKHHLQNSRVTLASNSDPGSEMSTSIACGVRALPGVARAVIINPADHAAVPSEVVAQLIAEWEKGALLIKPTWEDRGGHPVLIDLSFRDELLTLDPERGLKALFVAHQDQLRRVPVNSNYIARDLDTWDDYCALHQEVFGVPPPERIPPE
jgi:molybdenum cofactor cytidylyltransferase